MPLHFPALFVALLLLTGCSGSLLTTEQPAAVFYELDYPASQVSCEESFKQGVRVLEFSAVSPYDRSEMVVTEPGQKVLFSGTYQWIAPPGQMLAQSLVRDLSRGDLFPRAESGGGPGNLPLSLTGRIYDFAWNREGPLSRAVLEVEVSLADPDSSRVFFHNVYSMESSAFQESGKEASTLFAAAMSDLVKEFSEKLQKDLCAELEKGG